MKLALYRFGFWLWFSLRGYYLVARTYRYLFQRKYEKNPLVFFRSLEDLEKTLGQMDWKQDRLNGVLDVVDLPQKVQWAYDTQRGMGVDRPAVGDCDEFAIYAAVSVYNMIHLHSTPFDQPMFVSLTWFDDRDKFHGHNICVFYDRDRNHWCHIGNWHNGKAQVGFRSVLDCCMDFVGDYGQLIGYAAADARLRKLHQLHIGS